MMHEKPAISEMMLTQAKKKIRSYMNNYSPNDVDHSNISISPWHGIAHRLG